MRRVKLRQSLHAIIMLIEHYHGAGGYFCLDYWEMHSHRPSLLLISPNNCKIQFKNVQVAAFSWHFIKYKTNREKV